jgi:hypothetical protein
MQRRTGAALLHENAHAAVPNHTRVDVHVSIIVNIPSPPTPKGADYTSAKQCSG